MWHHCFYNQSAVQQGETVKRLLLAYAVTSPLDATGWDQWFHLTFSLLTRTFFTQTLTSMLMQSRISCIYTQAHISSHDFVSFVLQPCIINLHSLMLFAIWPSRSLNQVLTLRLERVAFYRPFSLCLTESLWQNSFYCWSMIKLSFTRIIYISLTSLEFLLRRLGLRGRRLVRATVPSATWRRWCCPFSFVVFSSLAHNASDRRGSFSSSFSGPLLLMLLRRVLSPTLKYRLHLFVLFRLGEIV